MISSLPSPQKVYFDEIIDNGEIVNSLLAVDSEKKIYIPLSSQDTYDASTGPIGIGNEIEITIYRQNGHSLTYRKLFQTHEEANNKADSLLSIINRATYRYQRA